MTRRPYLLLLASLAATPAPGQDTRPANFDYPETDRWMEMLLEFPEIKGDISVVMSCVSRIKANGRMDGTGCYMQNNYDQPFMQAIGKAAKKARQHNFASYQDRFDRDDQYRMNMILAGNDRDNYMPPQAILDLPDKERSIAFAEWWAGEEE